MKAVVRCVCSCLSVCVCMVLLQSGGQELGCVWAGLPDARNGCEVLLSFLIDSRDLIAEVGQGWQGAEDALWLSFLSSFFFLVFSSFFLLLFFLLLLLPPLSLYSSSSPLRSALLSSPLPFLRSQRSESARWCLCQRAATAGLHPAEDRRASSQRGPAVRHFPNSAGDPPGAAPLAAPRGPPLSAPSLHFLL